MYTEDTKITQNMPYRTLTQKSKAKTEPSHLLRHPARTQSGSIVGHTVTYRYMLAYLLTCPGPTQGETKSNCNQVTTQKKHEQQLTNLHLM